MYTEHAVSLLVPLLVLAVLWIVVRHWIIPFVLGFALAVALGPSARPLLASAWASVAQVGDTIFDTAVIWTSLAMRNGSGVHQGEVDTWRSDRLLFVSR